MDYGIWHDLDIEKRLIISGVLFLLVLQCLAAITTIVVNVWKLINGRKTLVQEQRKVVRKKYRKVWKQAKDYRPERDRKHPNYKGNA